MSPPHAAHTSPIVARGLVELVDAFDTKTEVATPLRDALGDGDEPWLSPQIEERFWQTVASEAALRDFPVLAPPRAPRGSFGAIELAVTTAPDVRSAVRTLAVTSDVLHGAPIFDLAERADGSAALIYRSPHARRSEGGAMAAELALASAVEVVRRATGEDQAAPSSAHLMGEPHARPAAIARELGCAVHAGAAIDRIELAPALLDLVLREPDPRTHRLAMRLVALERARALRAHTSTAARGVVRDLAVSREPTLETLARAAGLSPRALRARLADDATKIRTLLDEARRAAADRMLVAGARPTEIQRALGYADLASLRRAFRRWWGMGPLARASLVLRSTRTDTRATKSERQMSPAPRARRR